jgi:hypothetical protein
MARNGFFLDFFKAKNSFNGKIFGALLDARVMHLFEISAKIGSF